MTILGRSMPRDFRWSTSIPAVSAMWVSLAPEQGKGCPSCDGMHCSLEWSCMLLPMLWNCSIAGEAASWAHSKLHCACKPHGT